MRVYVLRLGVWNNASGARSPSQTPTARKSFEGKPLSELRTVRGERRSELRGEKSEYFAAEVPNALALRSRPSHGELQLSAHEALHVPRQKSEKLSYRPSTPIQLFVNEPPGLRATCFPTIKIHYLSYN